MQSKDPTSQQKVNSLKDVEFNKGQDYIALEKNHLILQQAYQNVCLERDLLRRAIKLYAAHLGTGIDTG